MSIQYDIQILRSKLIAMTRLTQRTVDYSIKAFQLGRPELACLVHNSKDEMIAIRCRIATNARKLLDAGTSAETDSQFACAALRISSALEVAYNSAIELARQTEARVATEWTPVSAELQEAGQSVNGLLRLCVLSLLNGDIRHAKAVLHNAGAGLGLDLAHFRAQQHLAQRASTQARFELGIIRCLEAIACQTREIADSTILWLEDIGRDKVTGVTVVHHPFRLSSAACRVTISTRDSACKAPGSSGAVPSREALLSTPSDDGCLSSQRSADVVRTEELSQARLMSLQQRVCELLVKNQQLRMALMAERADKHQGIVC